MKVQPSDQPAPGPAARPARIGPGLPVAWALTAMLGLAACASGGREAGLGPETVTPLDQFPVQVEQTPQQLALAVHAQGLTPNQKAALSDFVSRWRDDGLGVIEVSAPAGGAQPGWARDSAAATVAFLRGLGVSGARVRLTSYDASRSPTGPVIARFLGYAAVVPDCSKGWTNLTSTKSNRPYAHFGCVDSANLAAMIANPRDLVAPAAIDPSDASRREDVIQQYRQGQITSTPADPQASGDVSQ